jgi:putative transposase
MLAAVPLPLAPQELRTYFITAVTADRRRLFQVEEKAQLLQDTLLDYRRQGRFELHAFVIMPDHLHAIVTPAPDVSLEKALQYIKGGYSFRPKSKLDVWAKGYNESQIRTFEKFVSCRVYIEANPVRARLVAAPELFRFSSAPNIGLIDPCPLHLSRSTTRG